MGIDRPTGMWGRCLAIYVCQTTVAFADLTRKLVNEGQG
jgi:hypothetical protein